MSFDVLERNSICRTCLSKGNLKSIFQETTVTNSNIQFSDMIMECSSVKISKNDDLPSLICPECIIKLSNAYAFKKQCENADITLRFHDKNYKLESQKAIKSSIDTKKLKKYTCPKSSNSTVEVKPDFYFKKAVNFDIKLKNGQNIRLTKGWYKKQKENRFKCCKICLESYKINHICKQKTVHDKTNEKTESFKKENKNKIDLQQSTICDICNKNYTSKQSLKKHRRIHGEKIFLCSECGRGFVSIGLLNSHNKVHTGIKPYQCTTCGKSFSQSGTLKNHSYIHSGEKPFQCKLCGKAFTQRYHVVDHMRTHNGEKPFKCTVCNKSFAHKATLTVHLRSHTGETPYHCPVCEKGFSSSTNMTKHKRRHNITNSQ